MKYLVRKCDAPLYKYIEEIIQKDYDEYTASIHESPVPFKHDYNYIAKYIVKIFLNKNHINHTRNLNTVKKYKKLNLSNFNKFFN